MCAALVHVHVDFADNETAYTPIVYARKCCTLCIKYTSCGHAGIPPSLCALALSLHHASLECLRALAPQSFSFGEAAIVCQLMALLATDCLGVTATAVVCGGHVLSGLKLHLACWKPRPSFRLCVALQPSSRLFSLQVTHVLTTRTRTPLHATQSPNPHTRLGRTRTLGGWAGIATRCTSSCLLCCGAWRS